MCRPSIFRGHPYESNSGGTAVFRYNFAQISWVTISSSFYGHDAVFLFYSFFFLSFFCIYTQTSRPSCFLSKFKVRWSGSCAAVSNPSWIWQSGSLRAASILVSSSIHFLYLRTASFFTPPDTLSHFTQQCSHHSHCFFACFILLWIFRISSLFPASVLAGCFYVLHSSYLSTLFSHILAPPPTPSFGLPALPLCCVVFLASVFLLFLSPSIRNMTTVSYLVLCLLLRLLLFFLF